jgi:hypothetical protein
MKAREYIEHKYLPWILFLDKKDTIKHFTEKKEAYLCEMYNHISKEFNALERYELFMFRVEFFKQASPNGMLNIIGVKTPEVFNQGDAAYLFIVYNDHELVYYTIDYLLQETYSIKRYKDKKVIIIDNTTLDIKEIMRKINIDLMKE